MHYQITRLAWAVVKNCKVQTVHYKVNKLCCYRLAEKIGDKLQPRLVIAGLAAQKQLNL